MKYGIGDKVRVVNYGSLKFGKYVIGDSGKPELEKVVWDMAPEIVGQEGIICEAHLTQGKPTYAIDGIKGKHAWYNEDQLEMINPNPNVHTNPELITE